jgi:hypothetical protein
MIETFVHYLSQSPISSLMFGWATGCATGALAALYSIDYFFPGVRQAIKKHKLEGTRG